MSKPLTWSLLVLLAPAALAARSVPAAEPAQAQRGPTVERREMWLALQEFQRRWAARAPDADAAEASEVSRTIDAALRPYWFGHRPWDPDLARIAELTRRLRPDPEPAAETVARSLAVRPEPLLLVQGGAPVTLKVESSFPASWAGPKSLELVVRATSPRGTTLESTPLRVDPGEKLDVHAEVEFPPAGKRAAASDGAPSDAGVWKLELVARGPGAEGAQPVGAGVAWVVPRSLDALRAENEAKLAELGAQIQQRNIPALSEAFASLVARNALLSDRPDRDDSAQFTLDPVAHAAALEAERAALERGVDPYRQRAGDLWRIFPATIDDRPAALRVYAPPSAATAKLVPLVIALGSMGSDENTLLDLMVPRLRALADERGFLVACTRTSTQQFRAARFDELLNTLGNDYPIDAQRIYFLGHATGAAQLDSLLGPRGERIAACVSLGAANIEYEKRHVPVVVVGGGADESSPTSHLEKKTADQRTASGAVTLKSFDSAGWYLLPDAALEFAVGWLFDRKLE